MSALSPSDPRPRVLVDGLSKDEIEAIRPVCGSIRVTDGRAADAYPEEHDVLITTHGDFHNYTQFPRRVMFAPPVPPEDDTELFGAITGGRVVTSTNMLGLRSTFSSLQTNPAHHIDVTPFAIAEGLSSLVSASCQPAPGAYYRTMPLDVIPTRQVEPLLVERLTHPLALAALFEQGPEPATPYDSVLWLPDQARSYLPDWLRYAFKRWRKRAGDAFPESAEWEISDEWASPEERSARGALADFEAVEAERLATVDVKRTALAESVSDATASGDEHRQLLKATGDALVTAVAAALRALEFNVVDADDLPANQAYKKEDLQVTDGDWVALAEVKGYGRAAKSGDLFQVTKAANTYERTAGKEPNAVWLIVNAYREADPAQRPVVMQDRPEEIESFGENYRGLLIDTRDLFKLWQSVATGALSPAAGRAMLRETTGRFIGR